MGAAGGPTLPGGAPLAAVPAWRLRRYGAVHWAGLWAHTKRGILAFYNEALAHMGGVLVNSAMFLAVFVLASGGSASAAETKALTDFIAPGIIAFMMGMHAFQQSGVMIVHDRMENVIADTLMSPLNAAEAMGGYLLSAAITAVIVAAANLVMIVLLVDLPVRHPLAMLGFAALGGLLFGALGVLAGLWAEKWEQYSAAESFLLLPLGVLSGAFFALEGLAEPWRWVVLANPFHYLVEGFRWSALGTAGIGPLTAAAVIAALTLVLSLAAWRLFAAGYKLKP